MAGAGYKLFNTGDVLLASEVNTYLQQQTVMVFASSTARTTALSGVLAEGMMSYLQDTNSVEVYNGSSWVNVGNAGDITGVTAGTGISGGGSSGDVTITNSMATAIDAKGDLIVGTGADTFSRLAVGGTNGHVLTVDSGEATGMKWAAAAGGGKVLQVVQTTYATESSSTSTAYGDSGLSLSITPTSSNSKILVMANFATSFQRSAASAAVRIRLVRGATSILELGGGTHKQAYLGELSTEPYILFRDMFSFNYLDSPATTSSTTYKIQYGCGQQPGGATVTVYAQPDSNQSVLTLMEIGA